MESEIQCGLIRAGTFIRLNMVISLQLCHLQERKEVKLMVN